VLMDIGLGVLERFPSSRVDARGFLKMCRRLGRVLGSGGWARYGGDCAEDLGAERRWGGGEFVPAQAVDLLFRLVGPLAGVGCFLRLLFWLFLVLT
jgi:hypothetical protein